jgi:glutaminyl-peptide cyclotransferase
MQRVRAYSIEILLTTALIAAVFFFGYLGYGLLRPEVINEPFSGERALTSAGKLLDVGPRVTGTGASIQAGDWLIEQLRLLGWDVVIQPFSVSEEVSGRNIIAVRSNSQPGSPVIMLATPYDSRLAADADPDPDNQQRATPGANASASGVAVLLELARTLDVEQSGHTICLGFFDAEQNGGLPGWDPHLGSQIYVRSLPLSVPRCASPRYVVGVETVGAADQRFYQNEDGDRTLEDGLWQTAANLDYDEWFPAVSQPPTDGIQSAFSAAEMPATTIIGSDYPARNTMQDTLDKLNADTLQRVGMTLETWLETRP